MTGPAGSESGGVAHAYADERAGVEGGPEIGSTGEGRTTGHGSGRAHELSFAHLPHPVENLAPLTEVTVQARPPLARLLAWAG